MRLFLVAFQFLTIVPVPVVPSFREGDLGRSMAVFPLVGLLLGALLAGADYLMAPFLPRGVADLILIVLLTVVTGGMHLDGLADVCDGLAARGSRQRFLEVMKDPCVGAIGAVGLVLALALKYQALLYLPASLKREALFFFPFVARGAQVLVAVGSKRARADGLGASLVAEAGKRELIVALMFTLVAAWLLLGWVGLGCAAVLVLFTLALRGWFHLRLGGITGDVIGCISELNEILCLLILLATSGKG